jgi:hypothetical protein
VKGRPALGAAIGLSVGLGMVGLLVLLPRALQGSFSEVSDPLVIMGVPLLVIGAAVGAIVGGPGRRGMTAVQAVQPHGRRRGPLWWAAWWPWLFAS